MLSIRKISGLGRTYRHLNRYRQVLGVLLKYGFGDLVETLKIEQYIELGKQIISRDKKESLETLTRAERVRMALEELGPTFIKLGQIISTRPDLVPVEYSEELTKLQDSVPSFPYEEVRETVKLEAGRYPEELFQSFEEVPEAAASIGQVHRAVLKEGDEVVVKVQRPGIHKVIEVDLEIMLHIAGLMERHLEEGEIHQPTRLVQEFARTLEKEINYNTEAAHIERFAGQFDEDDTLYVPKVYREFTTERMLTMEYIRGIKASSTEELEKEGYDLKAITINGATLMLKQIFVHGFFHADPHPGNIFILPLSIICYLDFGMMGRITRKDREVFSGLVMGVAQRDEKLSVRSLLRLTESEKEPDISELEREVLEIADQHLYGPLKQIEFSRALQSLLEMLTRHRMRMKPDLVMMMKALSTVESLGRELDPDFNMVEHTKPFIRKVRAERLRPSRITGELLDFGGELAGLIGVVPANLRSILEQVRRGKIKVEFEHKGLEPVLYTHDRTSNRIAFAIVLASLIIGSSLIVLSGIPPKWHEIPVIGLAGYLVAGVMGLWLLFTIIRGGRM